MRFKDRADAGRQLAHALQKYAHQKEAVAIGLPRGGMVPAAEVARELKLPLDMVVVRKLGDPLNPELALGALAQDGTIVLNDDVMHARGLSIKDLDAVIERETKEAARRLELYRPGRQPLVVQGKTVLLIDDGIATGATVRAAVAWLRAQGAHKIVLAVPVAPSDSLQVLRKDVDELYILHVPAIFWGVGDFYDHFAQTTDEEVINLMDQDASSSS